jgi:hypothetical protein
MQRQGSGSEMSDGDRFGPSLPWRPGVAVGEGVRSALSGRWLSAVLVLLMCWAGALPGAVDAVMVAELAAAEQRFLDAGGNVVMVENREAGVPALACEGLAAVDGVYASAALIRMDEPVTVSVARGGDLPVFAATGGIWRLLDVEASPVRSGMVPVSAARRLGLVDGDWIRFERSPGTRGDWVPTAPMRVTVADTEILGDEFTGVVLPTTVTADTAADACVVSAEPARLRAVVDALPAALATGSGEAVVRDRLITGEFAADYSRAYRERPLQWAWLPAGVMVGLVWLLVRWLRRADDALYVTMGADATTRLLVRGTEWMVLAGLGALWAIVLGVVGAMSIANIPFHLTQTYVTAHVLATFLVATAVVLLGRAQRPRSALADLKDR